MIFEKRPIIKSKALANWKKCNMNNESCFCNICETDKEMNMIRFIYFVRYVMLKVIVM